jgi:hypothetical protein
MRATKKGAAAAKPKGKTTKGKKPRRRQVAATAPREPVAGGVTPFALLLRALGKPEVQRAIGVLLVEVVPPVLAGLALALEELDEGAEAEARSEPTYPPMGALAMVSTLPLGSGGLAPFPRTPDRIGGPKPERPKASRIETLPDTAVHRKQAILSMQRDLQHAAGPVAALIDYGPMVCPCPKCEAKRRLGAS